MLFDTKVQELKYKVLRGVAKHAMHDDLINAYRDIPFDIIPGKTPHFRCCVYKERHILSERVSLALGGRKESDLKVEVIEEACDECPVGGYEVTAACRGCIAHRCEKACPKDAIRFDVNRQAVIDKEKCIECGRCEKVCPYGAIIKQERPCVRACEVDAITMDEDKAAKIDESKCIECGACVYQCPFGAISDTSEIAEVVSMFKDKPLEERRIFAIVAPSIASQFSYAALPQVITGIRMLGVDDVVEAALGADYAAMEEARELSEKGVLTSSCCPSFVAYVEKHFPSLKDYVSHNKSPMAIVADFIRELHPGAGILFIGPCISKKREAMGTEVDHVLTFEELQALIDAFGIDLPALKGSTLDNASFYGRIFARSGGLSDAVGEALREQNIDFDYSPLACNGIKEAKGALLKLKAGRLKHNFIEGMACEGGCIGGPCCLTHGPKNAREVDKYGNEAYEKSLRESVKVFNYQKG